MPLLVHIPHASTTVPQSTEADFLISTIEFSNELLRLTDWHTDELFGEGWPNLYLKL